jgi:hypothetical protein
MKAILNWRVLMKTLLVKTVFTLLLAALCFGCGYGSQQSTPPSPGTVPTISALVPNNVNANSGGFVLTVNGGSFGGNAQVNWNGAAQTTTFVTAGQLTISVPGSMVTAPGMVSVTVTNPGTPGGIYGGGTSAATSTTKTFTIN